MTAPTEDVLRFDPYDQSLVADPYPLFRRLREEAPLYRNDQLDFYAVSRWDDVYAVLQDPQTYSNAKGNILEIIHSGMEMPSAVLIFEDPPTHTVHRKMLSRLFTPRRVAELEPRIREFCRQSLDPLVGESRFDIISELSAQIPMRAIGMLLGIPESEQAAVRDTIDAALRTESGSAMDRSQVLVDTDTFMHFVEWRSRNLSDDMMSQLLTAPFTDENGTLRTLTKDEVCTYITVVAGAGNETTGRLIGWAAKVWAEFPGQRRELVADPGLIPNALEEILRLEPPGPFMCRTVTRDVEMHGSPVPEGSVMMAMLAAANRDERRYRNAELYDIHRADIEHLTFGRGIHYCLGAALARLEARVAMEEFITRFPEWEVDLDGARLAPTSTVRGFETLPIVLDATSRPVQRRGLRSLLRRDRRHESATVDRRPRETVTGITGTWTLTIATPIGEQTVELDLVQDGTNVSGVSRNELEGESPMHDVLLAGNVLTWTTPMTKPIRAKATMTLTFDGDTASGTAKAGLFPSAPVRALRGPAPGNEDAIKSPEFQP